MLSKFDKSLEVTDAAEELSNHRLRRHIVKILANILAVERRRTNIEQKHAEAELS